MTTDMTVVFAIPIVLSVLCGIGSFMVRDPKENQPVVMTRTKWLNDAIAYASVPLFSEEQEDEQQIS